MGHIARAQFTLDLRNLALLYLRRIKFQAVSCVLFAKTRTRAA